MPYKKPDHPSRIRNAVSEDRIWLHPESARRPPPAVLSADNLREFISRKSLHDPDALGGSYTSLLSIQHSGSISEGGGSFKHHDKSSKSSKGTPTSNSKTNINMKKNLGVRYKGDAEEYSGFPMQSKMLDFDLEMWWRRSNMKTRINVIFVALLFVIMLMYLITGLLYVRTSLRQKIRSPYVCNTKNCHKASTWLTSTMNTSKDPCTNFYEFMCDKYRVEGQAGTEGRWMSELITKPAWKVEFGEDSMLAKLLSNFHNDPNYDQPIRFYQACLNTPVRRKFGLTAFTDEVENIFGTNDFSKYESISMSMEEIGVNMWRHVGDGSYLNFAFFTYPFITVLRPSLKLHLVFQDSHDLIVERVFKNLMPLLRVTDPNQITSAYHGVFIMSKIVKLTYKFKDIEMPKSLDTPLSQDFMMIYNKNFGGVCPPMGIQLNIDKIFKDYVNDTQGHRHRLHFFDLTALKHYRVLKLCFAEDPSKFSLFGITHKKTAFVSTWLFTMFWDFLLPMDAKVLMTSWNISKNEFPNSLLVRLKIDEAEQHLELRCMLALCNTVGYMPSIRFLASVIEDPTKFITDNQKWILRLFNYTAEFFSKIPPSEIDDNLQQLGKLIFGRGLHVDILKPLVNGQMQDASFDDKIQFGEDHLKNSIKGIGYIVERGRQNWLGSTDVEPNIRWWGYGEPNRIQHELFDIRDPFELSAEFVETALAANRRKWEHFLKRKFKNYILFPLTIFDEPHIDEALFLHFSEIVVEIFRTFYALLENPFHNRYAFLRYNDDPIIETYTPQSEDWKKLIWYGNPTVTHSRPCSILEQNDPNDLYVFKMDHSQTTGGYTWFNHENFLSLLALKQTNKYLQEIRQLYASKTYNWSTPLHDKKWGMQIRLPGKTLEKYSEQQLFFMAWVRTTCRGSWKKDDGELKKSRFLLETTVLQILMQMEEFQKIWKCKKKDFMSNLGYPRCFRYVP